MRRASLTLVAALLFFSAASVHSQAPQAAFPTVAGLQAIREANKALLEKQARTLETLDALKTAADQLKAFGKRG